MTEPADRPPADAWAGSFTGSPPEPGPSSTAALVLAAGRSRRLGEPKQLLDWEGRPLLQYVLEQVRGLAGVGPVIAVLGARSERIMEQVDLTGVTVVKNMGWREGIASSLRAGLDFLLADRSMQRAFIFLGDQPQVHTEAAVRLLAAQSASGKPAAIPRYRYVRGHPVLTDRTLWPRLITGLRGDQGARNLLAAHPEWVEEVPISSTPPADIDTPEDLIRLRGSYRPTQ